MIEWGRRQGRSDHYRRCGQYLTGKLLMIDGDDDATIVAADLSGKWECRSTYLSYLLLLPPPPPPPLISDHHNKHICRSLPLHFLPYTYIVVKLIDIYVMTTVQEHCSLHALKCIAGAESVRPINELHLISTPPPNQHLHLWWSSTTAAQSAKQNAHLFYHFNDNDITCPTGSLADQQAR